MTNEKYLEICKICECEPSYTGIWTDNYYPDRSNDGSTMEFNNPHEAFEKARLYAYDTGFLGVNYHVEGNINGDGSVNIDGYEGQTKLKER